VSFGQEMSSFFSGTFGACRSFEVFSRKGHRMRIQPTTLQQPHIERKPPPAPAASPSAAQPAAKVTISAAALQAAAGKHDADGDNDGH
jgi:hypothetical protein